jgi:hypothetical protein
VQRLFHGTGSETGLSIARRTIPLSEQAKPSRPQTEKANDAPMRKNFVE